MFENLRKKLKNLLGKEEPKKKEKKKESSKPSKKVKKEGKRKVRASPAQKKEVKIEQPGETQKEGFFSKMASKWGTTKLTEEQFTELFNELEITLLENNVAFEVVENIRISLAQELTGKELKKEKIGEIIAETLKKTIESTLQEAPDLIEQINKKAGTFTIVFFGINGSGKTTSVAKCAHYLKKKGISCIMAAADTFRAASIEQLETHGTRLGIPVIKQAYGSDPAAVAFDAKKYAEKNHIKVVLIDTAGRMYTRENLMKEMEKIIRIAQPDLKLFVGESITGNDATEQARMFNETAGIDGIILTKADVDEKGGTALSVSHITKKPIYFLGTGQAYDDFKPFKIKEAIKHLGLGD